MGSNRVGNRTVLDRYTLTIACILFAALCIGAGVGHVRHNSVEIATGGSVAVGVVRWDEVGTDKIEGESIGDDTIDDDSIDWTDVTLADFTEQGVDKVFYADAAGDVQEVDLGAAGTYLKSQGAAAAPAWDTPTAATLGDFLTTSPIQIDAGTNVDNILGGADADYTITAIIEKDVVATSPLTVNAGANLDNVLLGTDADITIAIADADADGATKGAAAFNATRFSAAAGVIDIDSVSGITGADEDDITDDTIDDLTDATTAGWAVNKVLKFNGAGILVVADYNEDLSFSITSFVIDGETDPVLLGSGQWLAIAAMNFDMTYDNGPPSAASIGIAGDFDDSTSGWTADTLTVAGSMLTQDTTEVTNYPDDSGDNVVFTLTADGETDNTPDVTFYNYFIYNEDNINNGFVDADLDNIAGGTQVITSDHTRTFTQAIGAANYMTFAHRLAGTTVTQVKCGTGSDLITAAFDRTDPCAVTPLKETVAHSNAAGNSKTENFYVYASLLQNLDDVHSNSFTTIVSATPQNYIRVGEDDLDTGWAEADLLALTFKDSTETYNSITATTFDPGALNYVIVAYPDRLGALTIGTDYEDDGNQGTSFRFDGVTAAFQATENTWLTNEAGFREEYKVYPSVNQNIGDGTGVLTTINGTTALNYMYFGSDTASPVTEAEIENLDTKLTGYGFTNGRQIKATAAETVTFTAGGGEYVWYCYPKRLGTVSFVVGGFPGGFQETPVTINNVENHNGWTEDYYGYRSDNVGNVEKEYVITVD